MSLWHPLQKTDSRQIITSATECDSRMRSVSKRCCINIQGLANNWPEMSPSSSADGTDKKKAFLLSVLYSDCVCIRFHPSFAVLFCYYQKREVFHPPSLSLQVARCFSIADASRVPFASFRALLAVRLLRMVSDPSGMRKVPNAQQQTER